MSGRQHSFFNVMLFFYNILFFLCNAREIHILWQDTNLSYSEKICGNSREWFWIMVTSHMYELSNAEREGDHYAKIDFNLKIWKKKLWNLQDFGVLYAWLVSSYQKKILKMFVDIIQLDVKLLLVTFLAHYQGTQQADLVSFWFTIVCSFDHECSTFQDTFFSKYIWEIIIEQIGALECILYWHYVCYCNLETFFNY